MIKVAIIDHYHESGISLKETIESSGLFSCKIFSNSDEVIAQENAADIILLEVGESFETEIQKLKDKFVSAEILMLTDNEETQTIPFLKAGASGCISRRSNADYIKNVLLNINQGGVHIERKMLLDVSAYLREKKMIAKPAELTLREWEVAQGIGKGLSQKLIADKLNMSVETVRHHIKNIYKKLGIHSNTELISLYFQENI